MFLAIAQAFDDLLAARNLYQSFLKGDEVAGRAKAAITEGIATLKRHSTTEFENWCCRLKWQCGGTKAKHPCAAITRKHQEFIDSLINVSGAGKNNPGKQCFAPLWALVKDMVGASDKQDSQKDAAGGTAVSSSSAAAPAAKRQKTVDPKVQKGAPKAIR